MASSFHWAPFLPSLVWSNLKPNPTRDCLPLPAIRTRRDPVGRLICCAHYHHRSVIAEHRAHIQGILNRISGSTKHRPHLKIVILLHKQQKANILSSKGIVRSVVRSSYWETTINPSTIHRRGEPKPPQSANRSVKRCTSVRTG